MCTLKLITTETFGDLSCNFYRNMNDDILLTREQIGQALEYADPSKAIRKIHLKHKDRLDDLCIRIKDRTFDIPQNGASRKQEYNLVTEKVYYTERGIMEICRWSRQPKANLFMDWVWNVIEAYRHNESTPQLDIASLTEAITTLTQSMAQMQQDINNLKAQTSTSTKPLPTKTYSRWKTSTFSKLRLLTDYANEHSDQELTLSDTLHITVNETQDTYDIELSDYINDYMVIHSLENKPYDLDVINYYKGLRESYTLTVDSILEKLNLNAESLNQNIFDQLAKAL